MVISLEVKGYSSNRIKQCKTELKQVDTLQAFEVSIKIWSRVVFNSFIQCARTQSKVAN